MISDLNNADSIAELVKQIETEMAAPHTPAELRAMRKRFSDMLQEQYGSVVIRIGLSLLRKRVPAARFMAYELIVNHPKAPMLVGSKELFRLGTGIDSPESADMFATYLVGPAWREGRIGDEGLQYWAKVASRWWRRTALVSTVPLNAVEHGGAGDTRRTLMICGILADDHDDAVVKGMVLALRELQKRDRKAVAEFVKANHERLAPRVLKEFALKAATAKKKAKAAK